MVKKGAFEVNSVYTIWFPVLGEILSLASKTLWYLILLPCQCPSVAHPLTPTTLQTNLVPFLDFASGSSWFPLPEMLSVWPAPASQSHLSSLLNTAEWPSLNNMSKVATTFLAHFPSPPPLCCLFPFLLHAHVVSIMALPHWNMSRLRRLSWTKREMGLW